MAPISDGTSANSDHATARIVGRVVAVEVDDVDPILLEQDAVHDAVADEQEDGGDDGGDGDATEVDRLHAAPFRPFYR